METETHPVIKVIQSMAEGKRYYELVLSRLNFNHLCAGCPEVDRLIGQAEDGMMFYIFENAHGEMPDSFRPFPFREGYFASIGAPVPRIPQGVTNEEFAVLSRQATRNLERAINTSGLIPIEEDFGSGEINLGYVRIRVEQEPCSFQ